ncbi:folliculin-interacting protein 2 isoform X1 [Anthonomus grandis grandis]|uniref:folliculin-interacting protein 2 isoform X1 n=1 Tax=Anthonomus grandis grandis TaxID=2921223 RepID=UPI002165F53C|nr:folliculin-interacting protein 2 isoform X1 [Anthonomus grandis grandis]
MALFKFFPKLRTTGQASEEGRNVSEKSSCPFGTDQVRLMLFRECDFRGRKLLFDSDATQKIPVEKTEADKKFIEITNGYGYLVVSKHNGDYQQLSDMVFGSVAMSFRGTYLKIHTLTNPDRIMFTQVFPSPSHSKRSKTSSNQSTGSSFEHSIRLDDSGNNSSFSTSDRLSDHSTASDTVLVCRRLQSSPLDVPGLLPKSLSKSSLIVDSGCADHSFSSTSTGPLNISIWESVFSHKDLTSIQFSSGVFKKLLRSSTRSLSSSISLPNSTEALHKSARRDSKLGLSIIINLSAERERSLIQFFMEHITLMESLIWRTHRSVVSAYHRPSFFISLMMETFQNVASFLRNLQTAPRIVTNLWHCLSFGCDNLSNNYAFINELDDTSCQTLPKDSHTELKVLSAPKTEFLGFNFSRILKTDWNLSEKRGGNREEVAADSFIKEFCELLEEFDVKDTNFFISTLITAVLTHHLGWVATVLPNFSKEPIISAKHPCNPLWSQLTDLYGAVGYPIKTAQTVITGTNKNNIVTKLLNSLTYFIRFDNVERKNVTRAGLEEENKVAGQICARNKCIPKQYYMKYQDHLKNILWEEPVKVKKEDKSAVDQLKSSKGLTKTKSQSNMSSLISEKLKCNIESPLTFGHVLKTESFYKNQANLDQNHNNVSEKCVKAPLKNLSKSQKINDLTKLEQDIAPEDFESFQPPSVDETVVFVLGENEKLVGLKKDESSELVGAGVKRKISASKRPSSLNILKSDKPGNLHLHESSSYESLVVENFEEPLPHFQTRAQSEPPEIRKTSPPKFRHSRVKFNLQQYPQVVKNYMKSKNIELEGLSLGEKVFDKFVTVQHNIKLDLSGYEYENDEAEVLQTPSNASEEFPTDMDTDPDKEYVKEVAIEEKKQLMMIVDLPMPKSAIFSEKQLSVPYTSTVMRGVIDNYIPDMVLQGLISNNKCDSQLKSNLAINAQHSLLDHPVDEALAIVANADTWEVQVMSSHTYVIDKGTSGVRAGMSQLVANMLESLLQMRKLHIPSQYCIRHIEQRLQELCLRSKALAQLLLSSEFCSIELLTSTLRIEVNDVPLLMAVASTHTPEVTSKYGLSFH